MYQDLEEVRERTPQRSKGRAFEVEYQAQRPLGRRVLESSRNSKEASVTEGQSSGSSESSRGQVTQG